jgi:hypothetical protein
VAVFFVGTTRPVSADVRRRLPMVVLVGSGPTPDERRFSTMAAATAFPSPAGEACSLTLYSSSVSI